MSLSGGSIRSTAGSASALANAISVLHRSQSTAVIYSDNFHLSTVKSNRKRDASQRVAGLCPDCRRGVRLLQLTGSVPAGAVEGLRQFDDNRCQRQGAATARQWRKLSPSADVVIDTECAARRAIRDTGVAGADRYHRTITLFRGA